MNSEIQDALLAMLEATAYDLWMAALHQGNQPLFERMANPQIGDTVMETTTFRRQKENRMGFGKLVAVEGEGQIETKWTIETPDGKVCNWTNAHIIAIPCGSFDWYPRTKNSLTLPRQVADSSHEAPASATAAPPCL